MKTKSYHVTNTNDSGPGSLREGLEAKPPKIIIFDVGGVFGTRHAYSKWDVGKLRGGRMKPISLRATLIAICIIGISYSVFSWWYFG